MSCGSHLTLFFIVFKKDLIQHPDDVISGYDPGAGQNLAVLLGTEARLHLMLSLSMVQTHLKCITF